MTKPTYAFTCNLVLEPPKLDRFYMDMRVYSVTPKPLDALDGDMQTLVWRGIYLAFEVGKSSDKPK